MKSVFLSNLHYFCAQTDGTYKFPNSAEGDLLKQAKKEIEALENENSKLSHYVRAYSVDPSRISNSEIAMARIALDERVVLEHENAELKKRLE